MEEEEGIVRVDCNAQAIDGVAILKGLINYILFTHHQIPDHLGQLENEHLTNYVVENNESSASNPRERREQNRKAREALRVTKKLSKLVDSVQNLIAALGAVFQDHLNISSVLFVLGSTLKNPSAVYEVQFMGIVPQLINPSFEDRQHVEKATKNLSAKAHANSCLPKNFVPKREFSLPTKKVHPKVIQLRCVSPGDAERSGGSSSCTSTLFTAADYKSGWLDELIWFQYSTILKGCSVI